MQNQEILKIIDNLKGRKSYEEKKASKLGFASLYDYFENKILKKKVSEDKEVKVEVEMKQPHSKKSKKSCSCC